MMFILIVFLPGIAALIAGLFGRLLGDRPAQLITSLAVTLSAILSIVAFFQITGTEEVERIQVLHWISSGGLDFSWAILVDPLTAVMFVVVNGVSALVHWYSIGYMSHDPHKPRFFAYLSLFTFAMLMLVSADNFVQLFFGWEGVGLASYLLIGFWFDKPAANAAAIKAFLVNRVGDFGFALGIMAIFLVFDSVDYATVFEKAPDVAGTSIGFLGMELDTLTVITFLLFIGAMGKSAQIFLHTWLPDAMEGPTPVSALIHAATMVTAGVFLVARTSPLFELAPITLGFVTVVGAVTALFAGTVALAQNDIKRVIAYSTCSQLGYMFFAAGLSAYSVAIFHLFTHAFFKALLFLGAGSVIHAMSDEQDMRRMGGLFSLLPLTGTMMWIGSISLAGIGISGVFGFSGFYSKDLILEVAWASDAFGANLAYWVGLAVAFLTALYSGRLLFMTFHGKSRASQSAMAHAHEAPLSMNIPNMVLTLGAILAGIFAVHGFTESEDFWGDSLFMLKESVEVLEAAHHLPFWVKMIPVLAGLLGLLLAWYFYIKRPDLPAKIAEANRPLYQFLLNKWYFDEIYEALLVRPAKLLGYAFWRIGDGRIIDGFGPDGFAAMVMGLARRSAALQSGFLYHYAFAMLIGVAVLVSWFLFFG
ncbi:MAG: NADH-quinone oxidoreductase subunit L [Alphaproteobacteria bacterium]|nr:NADH-quinone oxidoreductase subunit L [Alphaproteobacteria bacterium]